jgi:hypothetical protein
MAVAPIVDAVASVWRGSHYSAGAGRCDMNTIGPFLMATLASLRRELSIALQPPAALLPILTKYKTYDDTTH